MSAVTRVWRNVNASLVALARALLPSLSWRHHGIGVLQGYVCEGDAPEVRLHIWHPELVKPGMNDSGAIHDHRFGLVSHVLSGGIAHEECFAEEDELGDHAMLRLTHARAAADSKFHGPTEPLPGRFRVRRNTMIIHAGSSYSFPAGHFHKTTPLGLAVTCVEKHEQKPVSARLLFPIARTPVMAFGHDMNHVLCAQIIREAVEQLATVQHVVGKALGEP